MLNVPDLATMPTAVAAIVGGTSGDAGLLPVQAATLDAVARAFGHAEIDAAAMAPVGPEQVAAVISDPVMRRQLVQAMVMLAFLEHPPSEQRLASIRHYAEALDVDERAVKIFADYAHHHTKLMVFDIFRTVPFVKWDKAFAHDEGFATMARASLALTGKTEAPAVADKFRQLESCPAGSLGRQLWEMYQREDWRFPGERGGVPEATSVHDWVHILTGYAPTPIGEIQVTAFMAASSPDPHMFAALVLSLGLYEAAAFKFPIFPSAQHGGVMQQPDAPAAFADALRRGVAANTDLLEGIDHWALTDQPVTELRDHFHIVHKDEPHPTDDPGFG